MTRRAGFLLVAALAAGCDGEPDHAKVAPIRPGPPDQTAWVDEPHPAGDAPRIDIAFTLDSTASMQPLIDAAKSQIREIALAVQAGTPRPSVRFAVVAYRDRGDAYVTLVHGFSPDVARIERALGRIQADGGGDGPEHVVAGLEQTVNRLGWDPKAVLKFAFLLGDAPPHLDYGPESDIAPVLASAKTKGIVIGAIAYGSQLGPVGHEFWNRVASETGGPTEGIGQAGETLLESMLIENIRREAAKKGIQY
jgi:hypothetical protein